MTPADPTRPLSTTEEADLRRFVRWPGPIWADVKSTVLLGYMGQLLATLDAERAAPPEVVTDKDAEIARLGRELERCDGNLSLAADELNRLLAERAAQPSAALWEALITAMRGTEHFMPSRYDSTAARDRNHEAALARFADKLTPTLTAALSPAPTPVEPSEESE